MALTVSIITPEKAWEPMPADQVTLPAFDGQVGILPNHAAFVTQLGEGELLLKRTNEADHSYALRGGVAQVLDDEIRILAEWVVDTDESTEEDLLKELKDLDSAEYEDGLALAEAKSSAHRLAVQLKAKGKDVPDLKQLG